MESWCLEQRAAYHNAIPGVSITDQHGHALDTWQPTEFELYSLFGSSPVDSPSISDAGWHCTTHSDKPMSTVTVTATRDYQPGDVLWREAPVYVNTKGVTSINNSAWLVGIVADTEKLKTLSLLTPLRHMVLRDMPYRGIASILTTVINNMYSVMGNIHLYLGISYMNHSCNPNVSVISMRDSGVVVALKPIKAGDVLTVSYYYAQALTFNETQRQSFRRYNGIDCQCGSCDNTHAMQLYQQTSVIQSHLVDTTTYCANCHQKPDKLYRCGGCTKIFYCGNACQKQHWSVHKEYCYYKKRI